MPRSSLDLPSVEYLSMLDADGHVDAELEPDIPRDDLRRLYRTFLLARRFDERMLRLQRQGRIGTFGPIRGHEAAVLGSVYALRADGLDGALLPGVAGVHVARLAAREPHPLLRGLRRGDAGARREPGPARSASRSPARSRTRSGSPTPRRYKGEDSVTMVYLGDGATSHGDCQEAMNFAGVFQVPLVFFCLNNQWAISLPRRGRRRARRSPRRRSPTASPGSRSTATTSWPCYVATREAVDRARAGGGPTLDRGPHLPALAPHHGRRPRPSTGARTRSRPGRPGSRFPRFRRYLEQKGIIDDAGDAGRSRPRSTPRSGARSSAPRPRCSGSLVDGLRPRLRRADRRSCRPSARSSCASSPRPARRRTGNAPDGT